MFARLNLLKFVLPKPNNSNDDNNDNIFLRQKVRINK